MLIFQHGGIMLLIAVIIMIYLARAAFNRRNASGMEEFDGFFVMVATRLFEVVLVFIAIFFFGLGGLALLAGHP